LGSQRDSRHARLRALLAATLACAAVGATATGAGAGERHGGGRPAQVTGSDDPATLAAELDALGDVTASQWAAHETARGAFIDPVVGRVVGDYGVPMTGEALVQAGVDGDNQSLIAAGLEAELSEVSHPDEGGFELLSLSDAYDYDSAKLVGNPAWTSVRARLSGFLRTHGAPISDQGLCYASPHCYTNLKLVSAVAELALLRTGLSGEGKASLLNNPAAVRSQALGWLRMAIDNTGDDAHRTGADPFTAAGILSDPTENPLAYHALSTMMLGKAILMLGARAPHGAFAAFDRTAEALVGLMAPDGDASYIGRGQAQVWTVAATIDALALAAELTADPVWRGRYLSAAALELNRLETLYPSDGWGFPLVPGFAGASTPTNYIGIDHYANTVEYDGLALWALDDAATQIAHAQAATAQPLPSESDGSFVDPSHTRFVAVTHGGLWFAVHAINSNPGDARYGFGLLAAEIDTADGWEPALPPRPLSVQRTIGGVALLAGQSIFYPAGRTISATSAGVVTVDGRWRNGPSSMGGPTVWSFAPSASGEGVVLSFRAAAGAAYAFQVWFDDGAQITRSRTGVSVLEPDGSVQSYNLNGRVRISASVSDSSAYTEDLHSVLLTVAASPSPRELVYTTRLAAPTPGTGASGPSGPTGASGASGSSGASGPPGPPHGPGR
jgi:hypothetical protein